MWGRWPDPRWLDLNRPILVFCAAVVAAIGTDVAVGHRSALRVAMELPILLSLLIAFIWRLGHLGDDQEKVERQAECRQPDSNVRIRRNWQGSSNGPRRSRPPGRD